MIVVSRRTASLFALMDGLKDSGVPVRDFDEGTSRIHIWYVNAMATGSNRSSGIFLSKATPLCLNVLNRANVDQV